MFGKKKSGIAVQVNPWPAAVELDELSLVEIKEKDVIAKVIGAAPEIGCVMGNGGAVRGFFRQENGIAGHANLLSADGTAGKIAAVNESLSRIADFQRNEYRSKVMVLLTQVRRTAEFQAEILEKDELRREEIMRLQGLETTCMELLGQANLTMDQLGSREWAAFDRYSSKIEEAALWQNYQTMLIDVLFMIAELNYVLHLGALSGEQCCMAYASLYDQTDKTVKKIRKWHEIHEKRIGIDIDQATRERRGLDALVHKPLGLINGKYKYRSMEKREVEAIRSQKNRQVTNLTLNRLDLYQEDVRI